MAYMHGNKVEICGVNTSRLVTLGEAEKKELLLKARGGDAGARQRLIDGNLRLVLSVIRRFGNRGGGSGRSFSDRLHRAYQGGG